MIGRNNAFLSSADRDAGLASKIGAVPENSGLKLWEPFKHLRPGKIVRQAIRRATDQSSALVLIIGSPSADDSGWLSYEIGMFDALDKPVFVLAPNTFTLSDLPVDFRSNHVRTFDPCMPEPVARSVATDLLAAS